MKMWRALLMRHGDQPAHRRVLLLHLAQHRLAQHRQSGERRARGDRRPDRRPSATGRRTARWPWRGRSAAAAPASAPSRAPRACGSPVCRNGLGIGFLALFRDGSRPPRAALPSGARRTHIRGSDPRSCRCPSPRITYDTFQKIAPAAHDALLAMGKSADEFGVDKQIIELVKLRVSQINNCAFCLQIHLNVARRARRAAGEARPGRDLARGRHLLREGMRGAGLGRGADAASPAAACPTRPTMPCAEHFSEDEVIVPQRVDRQHQRLEPAGRRLPLRAADSRREWRRQRAISRHLPCTVIALATSQQRRRCCDACGQPSPSPSVGAVHLMPVAPVFAGRRCSRPATASRPTIRPC